MKAPGTSVQSTGSRARWASPLRALIGLAVLAAGLAACTPPPAENTVIYGMEAENDGGWCLPEGQLAIAGLQTARALYDPLTIPDENGEYVPFLAKDVTSNDDYTEWTITLRKGVTFHDGSPLTAQVVKNNLDANRGQYPGRSALLQQFIYGNIASVDVVDEYAVKVTTGVPWRAFPAFLNSSNRFGVMAQAQLDDPDTCDAKPIGTGPFMFESWSPGDKLVLKKNPDYWIEGYPLLDGMEFRPIPDGDARSNALRGDEIDAMHVSDDLVVDDFRTDADTGNLNMYDTFKFAELSYVMLNNSKLPFSNKNARSPTAATGRRSTRRSMPAWPNSAAGRSRPAAPAISRTRVSPSTTRRRLGSTPGSTSRRPASRSSSRCRSSLPSSASASCSSSWPQKAGSRST